MADSLAGATPVLDRFRLDGKTALVTGGGSGIGRAFCHGLADAGAKVAVLDLDGDRARQVAAEIEAKDATAMAVVADVSRPDAVDRVVADVLAAWGGLTIGVNNAGIASWVDSESCTPEQWRSVMSVNLDGVLYCCQAEARVMLEAGYGKIINTASMSGHIVNTPQHQAAYNSSKAAVIHLTRTLAVDWATRGVRVNSISPGYTRTELVEDLIATPEGAEISEKWMSLVPMQRMLETTDLQGAIVYMASPASDMMTGHDMVIDGGYTAL